LHSKSELMIFQIWS